MGMRWSKEVWGAAPACSIWCIWRERNQHTFEGVEISSVQLKFFLLLQTLFDWCSKSAALSLNYFTEFLGDMNISC